MVVTNMKWMCTIAALFVVLVVSAQNSIQWLTWDQAIALSKNEPKKFLVDVYTEWCGWCKKLDATTFKDPQVVDYVNKNFYPIKFNAEQREDIKINDHTYQYVRNGNRGYNQLAAKITNNRLSYPTLVFMDENLNVIQPVPGYKESHDFQMMMRYFAENYHKTTPWNKFINDQDNRGN